jgi:hypothetical protein
MLAYVAPEDLTQLCLPCPTNTESISHSTQSGMCLCRADFTHTGETLPYYSEVCAGGTIKINTGNVPCTPCGENEYSLSTLACDD